MELIDSVIRLIWAKSVPFMSLWTHSMCAGLCAEEYLSARSNYRILNYLSNQFSVEPSDVIHIISYLSSVHDIGKAHPAFQSKDKLCMKRLQDTFPLIFSEEDVEAAIPLFRHEHYSAKVLERIWKSKGYKSSVVLPFSTAISLHHQKPKGQSIRSNPKNEIWSMLQNDLEKKLCARFLKESHLKKPENVDATLMLITSIIILMDWVSSSELFCKAEGMSDVDMRKCAGKALRLYGLISDDLFPAVDSFEALFPFIAEPRPLQKACSKLDERARLTIVEAPMGEGKTEAAFYFASRQCNAFNDRGIYMALPSQATSNQIHIRLNDMLTDIHYGNARLLHGTAFLTQKTLDSFATEDEQTAAKWMRPTRMGFLGTNAVGTVDQAMSAVLRTKFSMIRLAGLCNKVLIIDEIHAYDQYMSQIVETLLCWCYDLGIPVILLSATMQISQKKRYLSCFGVDSMTDGQTAYPVITQVGQNGDLKQINVEASSHYHYLMRPLRMCYDARSIASLAVSLIANGGCVAIMVNTVAHAQDVFREVKKQTDENVTVMLFHSRFPLKRRSEIEQQCVERFGKDRKVRPDKGILVATQVVEQSIDLDFDGMISEIAPVDLLLQRAGRIHRHREYERPTAFQEAVMTVLLPSDSASQKLDTRYGASGVVYDPFLLWNTEQELQTNRIIKVPEDIRTIVESTYATITKDNQDAWLKRSMRGLLETTKAKGCTWPTPEKDTFFPMETAVYYDIHDQDDGFETTAEASTRLGDGGARVAFCDDKDFDRYKEQEVSVEDQIDVYMNSVPIRLNESKLAESNAAYLIKKGRLAGIWLLRGKRIVNLGSVIIINDAETGVQTEVIS